ncbi:MAG: hypothetical protein Q7R42_03875 [Candidatus Planktophila sp.]|nr:hypothetical protein [Candidatus Planktophila sp.]
MKKFVFLYNFEPNEASADDSMDVWMAWFTSINASIIDMGNPFMEGLNVTKDSTSAITADKNPITGYTLIKALDMDAAVAIAKSCPSKTGVQVYEAVEM